ncbi:MAG TPA: FixH family protein [Bacteroidia bacterium]|jgi:hypothetical protein|nr:FixH family protein [Bacteroidia bacterium]
MNWGIRITILYVVFVVMILTMVYMASSQKVELVSDDYYKQELAFQQQIDRSDAASRLLEQPTVIPGVNNVEIQFPSAIPSDSVSGKILFLRPSDASLDREFPIKANASLMEIPNGKFSKGLYQVKMNWTINEKKYYNEYSIYIP